MATALLEHLTNLCRILKTGNDGFRFKASSAAATTKKKEANRDLTALLPAQHNPEVGQFSVEKPAQFYAKTNTIIVNSSGSFAHGVQTEDCESRLS